MVVELCNQLGQVLVGQNSPLQALVGIFHCLEPNPSNPQVSPEVTHQVKVMEKEALMDIEVVQLGDWEE